MRFQRHVFPVALACLALAACGSGGGTDTLSSDAGIKTITLDSVALASGALTATLDCDVETAALELVLPAGASATIDGVAGTSASIEAPGFGRTRTVALVVSAEDGTKKSYSFVLDQEELGALAATSTVKYSSPRFYWAAYEAVAGVSFVYDVYVWKTADAVPTAASFSGRTSPYLFYSLINPSGLEKETGYSWKVVVRETTAAPAPARALGDILAESGVGTFTTAGIPAAPANLKLYNDAANAGGYYLMWDEAAEAESYYMYRNDDASGSGVVYGDTLWHDAAPGVTIAQYRIAANNDFGTSAEAVVLATEVVASGGFAEVGVE